MGMHSDNPSPDETRTTAKEEAARRTSREREQAEHPELLAGRGRDAQGNAGERRDEPDARPGQEGSGSDDRLTPRRNEDISEG